MEIENHILSLTMEFERQNIIITEWEAEKAKNAGDRRWKRKQDRKRRDKNKQVGSAKKGKAGHKKKKSMSAVLKDSIKSTKSTNEEDSMDRNLPKIVIQPSLSDNDEDHEGTEKS